MVLELTGDIPFALSNSFISSSHVRYLPGTDDMPGGPLDKLDKLEIVDMDGISIGGGIAFKYRL